jgi:hypothetical protein
VACAIPDQVVTPQVAVLGLPFLPEAETTICAFVNAGADAPYPRAGGEYRGLRDSLDATTKTAGDAVYLPLDQARMALALLNAIYPDFDGGRPLVRHLFGLGNGVAEAYAGLAKHPGCAKPE